MSEDIAYFCQAGMDNASHGSIDLLSGFLAVIGGTVFGGTGEKRGLITFAEAKPVSF